jgi:hypothetical protein
MFGAEARFGLQLNNLVAIYAQPYLAFGTYTGTYLMTAGIGYEKF